MFGPFTIKRHRTELKRYNIIFTWLASRAVHLEVANTIDTDSFIQALRRFIARRGNMRMLRPDNGTNFVGGGVKPNYQRPFKKWTLKGSHHFSRDMVQTG